MSVKGDSNYHRTLRDLVNIDLVRDYSALPLDAQFVGRLSNAQVAALVAQGDVEFVVRDKRELRLIPIERTHSFWKDNVSGNVISPERIFAAASSFISGFYYLASEWDKSIDIRVVLLEIVR